MKKISIVGFGRFGKTLHKLLKDDFDIVLYDTDKEVFETLNFSKTVKVVTDICSIYKSEVVFYCVPICSFEKVIKGHKKYFTNQLLIDVLSVKQYPASVFKKYLKGTNTQALLTHPMFGPDSSKKGFKGLPLVMDKFTSSSTDYNFWKSYFKKKELRIVEMSACDHDKLAANSQGVTHFIGRLLEEFGLQETPIDTLGAKKLQEVMEQTCNDTWELFMNLQNYNPYTKKMRIKFGKSYDKLYNKLLPKRISSKYVVYGIQGGIGSFNEEAILIFIKKHKIRKFKIKYLYTTKRVLENLYKGNIDFGLFAIQNSVGGIVEESVHAMAKYKFKIFKEFVIPIRHFLMKRKGIELNAIAKIMAHPQVLKQCRGTIKKRYSNMKLVSGTGDFIDTAKAAWALSKGKLGKDTAILGPKGLSSLYDLKVIGKNLQDDKTNNTSFLLVTR